MSTMLAVVAPSYTDPSNYILSDVPKPNIALPTDVLIKVHAASVNPVDVKKAAGALKLAIKDTFPYFIGFDAAGVVEQVGSGVMNFSPGDEVFVRLPEKSRGSFAEYAMCDEYFVALKPKSIDFEDAASIPLAAMTALQAMRRYKGSLEGKTIFIPGGLSGTGAYACQLAKNVFRAGRVITTVSTSKVPKVPQLLGAGVVDQIIDYTKEDVMKAMQLLSLMTPNTGTIISISTMPSGAQLQESNMFRRPDKPQVPFLPYYLLTAADAVSKLRARRWGVEYSYMFLDANGVDLAFLAKCVDSGKLRPIVGTKAPLHDLAKVREACGLTYSSKGGLGKIVLTVL